MVYVLDKNGQPLMPTTRHGKVRRLLNSNKAKVIDRCPFTIQLLYETGDSTQPITLGVDAGSKVIGVSATTNANVLYEAEVILRGDIVELLSARRAFRRARRNRKTRYRKPRFDNRTRAKHKEWLAPSVEAKIASHQRAVKEILKILPITEIIIEVASFDIQKIKAISCGAPVPEGTDYQTGEQLGFWNAREYVFWRDGHTCQCCKGRSGDKILNVHHIESRKTGGNAPNNLITLCETCHKKYHRGEIELPKSVRRGASYKDAAFMNIMRWVFYSRLKEQYSAMGINTTLTYGYITKNTRITNGLEKLHRIDARCISGHPNAAPPTEWFAQKTVRRHNRQIHKCTISKGGMRKLNQAPKYVFGYQLFDKVVLNGQEGFVFGRRTSGSFDIRTLDGTKLSAGVSYKKLKHLEMRKTTLTERRTALLPIV